jgi:hypothetical protein
MGRSVRIEDAGWDEEAVLDREVQQHNPHISNLAMTIV